MKAILAATLAAALSSAAWADNTDQSAILTLAAQGAGTVVSADQVNSSNRCLVAVVNLTTVTAASVVVHIAAKDSASGAYYDVLVGPALTAPGVTPMYVCPGIIGASNSIALPVPRTWRVSAVVTGVSSAVTGTVGASQTE